MAVANLVESMMPEVFQTQGFEAARKICRAELLKRFPILDTPKIEYTIALLVELLKTTTAKPTENYILRGWLSKLAAGEYGITINETLHIKTINA